MLLAVTLPPPACTQGQLLTPSQKGLSHAQLDQVCANGEAACSARHLNFQRARLCHLLWVIGLLDRLQSTAEASATFGSQYAQA